MAKSMRDKILERRKKIKESQEGGKFFTIKEGTTRFRHLQLAEGEEPGLEVIYFYLGDEIKGYVSPATFGLPCAVHKKYLKMKDSKDADDRQFVKDSFRMSKKFFGFGVKFKDEDGNEVDGKPKLLLLTPGLYDELLAYWLDEKEAGDFTDPINGYDVKYERTGTTKMNTEYHVRTCKPTKAPKAFRKEVYNLEEMVKAMLPTYEESKDIINRFLAIDTSKDDDEKGNDRKKKKKKKNRDL